MDIEISQGSSWPVDPRFIPVAGLDETTGAPRALRFGSNGLLVETVGGSTESAGIGTPGDAVANNNTGSHSMISLTKRLLGKYEAGQKTMGASLPVAIASDQIVTTRRRRIRTQGTFTRPADTTPYSAGDAVSDSPVAPSLIHIPDVVDEGGGSGLIRSVRMSLQSTTPANIPFRVWFFSDMVYPFMDNQPFPLRFEAEWHTVGYVDLTPVTEGSGSDYSCALVTGLSIPYRAVPYGYDLYAALVVKAEFTPMASMVVGVEISVTPD